VSTQTVVQKPPAQHPAWRWIRRGLGLAATGAALSAAALGYAYAIEPQRIELERLTLRLPRARDCLPARGLRILHLSDSHFQGKRQREHAKIARIRRLARDLDYDLLIHTGDFIHYDSGVDNALALLDAVPPPRLGRYAVLGNHDYAHYAIEQAIPRMWRTWKQQEAAHGVPAWMRPLRLPWFIRYVRNTPLDGRRTGHNNISALVRHLEAAGFTVLHNCNVHLEDAASGLDLYLAGVDDVTEGRPRLGTSLDSVPDGAPVVLLSHNPDILASPRIGRVDVVLSGHTHGGQIVLPLWGPAHTQSWELERDEVSGCFRRGHVQVYVTRGIGEGIPLRWNAPPQITLITLLPEGEPDGGY
jgi:uncharacterized protein